MIVDIKPVISVRRRVRHPVRYLALSVVCALALSACTSGGSVDHESGGAGFVTGNGGIATVSKADRKVAPRLSGETLHGERLDLADYKGKVVVLNVWGSWCTPCRAEAPHFARVAKDLKSKGVEFIGINTRNRDKVEPIKFEQDFGVPYPSFYDPYGKMILEFPKGSLNPQLIPSTIVVDRDGKVAARALMAMNEDQLRKLIGPLIDE
ncbi:TlpA disulfide reductase family protein [Streptomyces sp. TRM49041]|uniref:TlpA family protein disulfide reductase n=1 Tax=Streptomyces sp. TRM49041 TaxID=2603216 RepID=UPI0011EF1E45|nr:TlpA disulfide reductase family protein [Streptomyces sp. TRM49041]